MSVAFASVSAGQSQLLLITGEAGIGKTRLVEELVKQVEAVPGQAQVRMGESAPLPRKMFANQSLSSVSEIPTLLCTPPPVTDWYDQFRTTANKSFRATPSPCGTASFTCFIRTHCRIR